MQFAYIYLFIFVNLKKSSYFVFNLQDIYENCLTYHVIIMQYFYNVVRDKILIKSLRICQAYYMTEIH